MVAHDEGNCLPADYFAGGVLARAEGRVDEPLRLVALGIGAREAEIAAGT